jgi:NADH:ubiquinone oxidoreductase subunit 4 (subunit M)
LDFDDTHLYDLSRREMLYFGAMMIGLIWMGMYPQNFLDMSAATLTSLLNETEQLLFAQGSEL